MKMKKGLALLLAACSCFAFAACEEDASQEPEHEHAYATEWTKDATDHWHVCEGEDCTEVADKAVHEWNAGEITTEASASADGVKTFTCTVCAQTKTESVPYVVDTEVTAEEWLAALSFTGVDNFEYTQKVTLTAGVQMFIGKKDGDICYTKSGALVADELTNAQEDYYEKDGESYYRYNVSGGAWQKTAITKEDYDNFWEASDLSLMFDYENFEYNAETKCYEAASITKGGWEMANIKIGFLDGRVKEVTFTRLGTSQTADLELQYAYGGVELTLPEVTVTTATAE